MKKKLLSMLLTGCMVVSMITGCGSSDSETAKESSETKKEESSEAVSSEAAASGETPVEDAFEHDPILNDLGVEPICKEKVKLTIGIKANSNVEDFETNYFTKLVEERANVDLEFITYVGGEAQEKLRIQIAGNEKLPDIIMWTIDNAEIMDLGEEGFFVPLEDYYENSSYYAVAAYEGFKEKGIDVLDYATTADGHIWQAQRMTDSLHNPTCSKMWVDRSWMEAVGMTAEDVKDAEGFYELMKRFKTEDPNGNGVADEIPLIGYTMNKSNTQPWVYLMNAFTETNPQRQFLRSENGQLSVAFTQDEFKEGVKYISKMVQEGLYDPVSFTQDFATMKSIVNATETPLAGGFCYFSPSFTTEENRGKWELLDPLVGADGNTVTAYAIDLPISFGAITSSCEHPEVAFRVLDLMADEYMSIVSRYGQEGVNWAYAKDVKDDYPDVDWSLKYGGYEPLIVELDGTWGKLQNAHWVDATPNVRPGKITGGVFAANIATGKATPYNVQMVDHYLNYEAAAPAEPITGIKYASADEQVEADELYAELSDYVLEMLTAWFTGTSDVEADWDTYLETLEDIGLSDWLAIVQAGWK